MNFNFNEQLMSIFHNCMAGLRRALNQKLLAIMTANETGAIISEKEYKRLRGQTVSIIQTKNAIEKRLD
jgi:hypothetical protein